MLHTNAPDGFLVEDLIVWEELGRGGAVAQGFRIETLDSRAASDAVQEELRNKLVLLYQNLPSDIRLQHRFRPKTPFGELLERYDAVTVAAPHAKVRDRRRAHSRRFRELQRTNRLRAEELILFFGLETKKFISSENLPQQVRQWHDRLARLGEFLRSVFSDHAVVTPLGSRGHLAVLERTLDPATDEHGSSRQFDAKQSLCEQLFASGIAGHAPHGIHTGGFYQAIVTLKSPPTRSEAGLFHALTSLPFNRYEVVINVAPLDIEKVIRRKEETIAILLKENLAGATRGEARVSKEESARREEEQVRRLYRGNEKMFSVTYAVRLWAPTEAELTTMVALAQRALESMGAAQSYLATLAVTTRKLFFATWPGWMWGDERRALELTDIDLADIVPFTSTFHGRPDAPEILLDGASGRTTRGAPRAIVALPSFLGTPPTPQHTLFIGSTGAGKTTTLNDMAFQSSPYFSYEVLVEEGNDYADYAAAHGCQTIRVQTDGTHTINYLDTGGLPLSTNHLSFASALALHMCGVAKGTEGVARRRAILNQFLRILYGSAATDWLRKHREDAHSIAREALAVREWHRRHLTSDDSLTEAWTAIRDGLAAGDARVRDFVGSFQDAEVFQFAHDPVSRASCEAHAFTRFQPAEYPQHAALAELLLTHRLPEFRSDEVNELATLLRNWTAGEGDYGPLFDGVTTVRLDARVVHFELGRISEEQRELKTAVSLLMTGKIRQRIVQLPRTQRKRAVIEEMMRFLDVPDGDKLVVEFCAQMRKYGCVVWMVLQQLQKLLDSGIAPYVIGNCRQYVILKQLDAADVTTLANRLPGRLPEALQQEILSFQSPENLPADDRYSSLVYFNPNLVPPLAGTARLYLPEEVVS